MPDARMIHQQVEARIAELESQLERLRAEYDQLKRLADTFGAQSPGPPSRTRRSRPAAGSASRASAATGGSRARQAVELIGAQPGLTASDLAAAMGMSRNYLYRVLPRLERRGVIVKQGGGYRLAS